MFQNGVDKKTLIGMTKRLIKNFGNLAEEAYEKEPDWKRVFRGKYEIATKGEKTWFREYIKDYKFSSEKSVGKKIKVGTNWAGVVFSGILNAIDNYEEFGTTKSKRFWEETLLETAFEVMEDITVRAVVSVALTAICGGATVVAISAVTVRKKVDDMRVKFEKIKEKIENNWSGENKDSYIRKINIIHESLQPIPKELDDLAKSLKSTAESEYKKDLAKEEKQ